MMDVCNTATEMTKITAKKLAKLNNLELSIASNISHEDMNKWYNSLKIFVSLSAKNVGFNLAWLEAKVSGVPEVIGNENGIGISRINKDWKKMTWENNVKKLLEVFGK